MAGSVEDEFNALVEALNQSEYTKEESILILKEYANVLFRNNIPLEQRLGVAMTTGDFIKRVRKHDWKFAHGFFGNWAKAHAEDQDVGCQKGIKLLRFTEYLQERVLNIGFNPRHEKHREAYRQQIHDVMRKSYSGIGGYGGLGSGTDAESKAIHSDISSQNIKATRRGDTITTATIYKPSHGRKIIGTGTNKTEQGSADWKKTAGEDIKQKRAWGEFSGRAGTVYKKMGMPQRSSGRAAGLTGKPDVKVLDRKNYERNIGGEPHKKTILGFPEKT